MRVTKREKEKLAQLLEEIEEILEKLGGGKTDLLVLRLEDCFQEIEKIIGE